MTPAVGWYDNTEGWAAARLSHSRVVFHFQYPMDSGVIPYVSGRTRIAGVTYMIAYHRWARRPAAAPSTITSYLCPTG